MTEMVHGALPAREVDPIFPKWWRSVDKTSMACVLVLFGIGLLLGFASSPPLAERNGLPPFYYVFRQAQFGFLAILTMIVTSMLNPLVLRRLAVFAFIVCFVSIVLLPFFGTDFGKGSVRWYSFGFASVQPSEFLKPVYAVFTAWLIAASCEINGPPGKILSFVISIILVTLLALQPDFGQACLLLFTWGVIYFLAGAPWILIFALSAPVLAAGSLAYQYSEHFARRIDGFLSPDVDPRTQLGYAANAIQEGGFFGVGIGEGQVKWSLPDAHTDFIIAVAAEEYGLVLVLVIMALFAVIIIRSLLRLIRERDPFLRLAGTGLTCLFGVQALINMGVAVRLLPAKGMTLPFVSYGGSSLIAAGLALGLIFAFTRSRAQGEIEDVLRRRGTKGMS